MKKVIRLPTAAKRPVKNRVMVESAGNVIAANVMTRLDVPAGRVLHRANKANLTDVVVIGWDADGDLYFAASNANGAEILWFLEMARRRLMEVGGG